jgi:hypothetical protein
MQAANFGTNPFTPRRSIDPYLDRLIAGGKLTKLERFREEYIERYGKNWGREWNEMADKKTDVVKWLEMRGIAPRGYQVFYGPEQIVGGQKLRDIGGYIEHSEECGGVALNPGWYPPARSFGEY